VSTIRVIAAPNLRYLLRSCDMTIQRLSPLGARIKGLDEHA
jgi:hypothetical protein